MNQEDIKKNIIHLLQSRKISRVISGHWSYKSYGEHIYNQTLFEEFGGVTYSEDMDYILLRYTLELKLEITIRTLEKYIEEIKEDTIFYDAIQEKKQLLELALHTLPYELEKAGYLIDETIPHKKKRAKEIQKIETQIWGERISENTSEAFTCLNYLQNKFEKNKELLKKDEKWDFTHFLKKIQKGIKLHMDEGILETRMPKKREALSREFFEKFGNTFIKREDYIEIFQKSLHIYGLKDIEIQSWNGGNISITKDILLIPESSSYNFLSLQRILCLIYHEIAVHGITWKNQKRFFGSLRGSKYYEKEEGLASYLEARLLGYTNEDSTTSLCAHSRILGGEILPGKEYWEFIRILRILTGQMTGSTKKSFLRTKIYQSYHSPGVTRKEISYVRGFNKVQGYVSQGKDLKKLFIGKLSFEKCEEFGESCIEDEKFVRPFSLSDYLVYYLAKKYFSPKDYNSYSNYLTNKYNDIHTIFRDIDTLEEEKLRKLEELLNFVTHILYKNIYPWK